MKCVWDVRCNTENGCWIWTNAISMDVVPQSSMLMHNVCKRFLCWLCTGASQPMSIGNGHWKWSRQIEYATVSTGACRSDDVEWSGRSAHNTTTIYHCGVLWFRTNTSVCGGIQVHPTWDGKKKKKMLWETYNSQLLVECMYALLLQWMYASVNWTKLRTKNKY